MINLDGSVGICEEEFKNSTVRHKYCNPVLHHARVQYCIAPFEFLR